jgi:hypothetical protein
MIPANECYPVWIPHFQAEEKKERFEGIEAPVHKVA